VLQCVAVQHWCRCRDTHTDTQPDTHTCRQQTHTQDPGHSHIYTQKSPIYTQKSPLYIQKSPKYTKKEPYIHSKQRYIDTYTRPRSLAHMHAAPCIAVCCSVLQCVAVCVAVCCSVLQCVLQCVAVCCSVLQCVAQGVDSSDRDKEDTM